MLEYTKRTLENGLDVIVHEDHRCPIVAINLWYHVGSKNEQRGRTGLAHLFEHLMFEGSAHHDSGYFTPLQQAGAALNGSTNSDRTNYWEVLPTTALELGLWLESDRMGYLLPALTSEKFENQRDVVLNERRQQYENRPYGLASMALMAALFPPDHPYHWTTIGETADIQAATLDDAHEFFRSYYHPGNASLAVAGDVNAEAAFALVEQYFEDIPSGSPIPPVGGVPEISLLPQATPGETYLFLEDDVELPRLYLAWPTPRLFAQGDAEMDVLADVLTGGKTSRLYRTLVYDKRIATDVSAAQGSRELASWFCISATAAPGHELVDLERVIVDELERLSELGPDVHEIERSLAQMEAQFIYQLETVGGFSGRSDQLNAYNIFAGDPGFMDKDLMRYRGIGTDLLREEVSKRLSPRGRVTLSIVPRGSAGRAISGSIPAEVV